MNVIVDRQGYAPGSKTSYFAGLYVSAIIKAHKKTLILSMLYSAITVLIEIQISGMNPNIYI